MREAIGVALAASIAGSLYVYHKNGFPLAPGPKIVLPVVAVGAIAVAAWERTPSALRGRRASIGTPAGQWSAGALLGILAAAALTISASGWVSRGAALGGKASAVIAYMSARPGYASSTTPVSFAPSSFATLAGDRLTHPLSLIPAGESCAGVRARLARGWVVVEPGASGLLSLASPFTAGRCLSSVRPVFAAQGFRVYAPGTPMIAATATESRRG